MSRWSCQLHQLSRCISLYLTVHWAQKGKVGAGKLKENSRSPRNCRRVYSLLSGTAAGVADSAVFSPLVVDPADTALMQPHHQYAVAKTFSGGAYICLQNISSLWSSEYLVMCMCGTISDLSCYIIIIYKMWGESERVWGEGDWPRHLGWFALSLQWTNSIFKYECQQVETLSARDRRLVLWGMHYSGGELPKDLGMLWEKSLDSL